MTSPTNFTTMTEAELQDANGELYQKAEEQLCDSHSGKDLMQALNTALTFRPGPDEVGAYVELYFANEADRHLLSSGNFTPIAGSLYTFSFSGGAQAEQAHKQLSDLTMAVPQHQLRKASHGHVRAFQLYDCCPEQSNVAWNVRISVAGNRDTAQQIAERLEVAIRAFLLPVPYYSVSYA